MTEIITIFPTSRTEPITILPSPKKTLKDELEEQGWKLVRVIENGEIIYAFEGTFKGRWRKFKGFVWRDENVVFIKNIPDSVKSGPHGICFSATTNGWYSVHFSRGYNPLARICVIEEHLKEMGE